MEFRYESINRCVYKLIDLCVGETVVFEIVNDLQQEVNYRKSLYLTGTQGRYGKFNYFPNVSTDVEYKQNGITITLRPDGGDGTL